MFLNSSEEEPWAGPSKLSECDGFELRSLGNLRPQLKPFLSGRKYN